MQNYNDLLGEMRSNLQSLGQRYPDQMRAFQQFRQSAEGDGALPHKFKAILGVATSVTAHCDWCIATHVRDALDAGASPEEILEATWVAVLMGGGPALMYAQGVLKALEDFGA